MRGLATPWTYFLHLPLSSVILIDSSAAAHSSTLSVINYSDGRQKLTQKLSTNSLTNSLGWLGNRVVNVLDSGTEGTGFKSQSQRCRVTVLGKLFTSSVPLFTK